jgi:hypothetical protein
MLVVVVVVLNIKRQTVKMSLESKTLMTKPL